MAHERASKDRVKRRNVSIVVFFGTLEAYVAVLIPIPALRLSVPADVV